MYHRSYQVFTMAPRNDWLRSADRTAKPAGGEQTCWFKSGESEVSRIRPSRPRETNPPKKKKREENITFNNPSYKYVNPVSRIVGTSGKRLPFGPTNDFQGVGSSSRADSQLYTWYTALVATIIRSVWTLIWASNVYYIPEQSRAYYIPGTAVQ